VTALTSWKSSPTIDAALKAAALSDDPEIRALGASAIGRQGGGLATSMAGSFLSDRVGFQRIVRNPGVAAEETAWLAASQIHAQGVVLPYLVEKADVESLGSVMGDRSLSSLTRLGALEALAALGREDAEDRLRALGLAADDDEELRKAAWRGLRRSKRARAKAKAAASEVRP
jgi:ParB family chromosome partitioning protein